MEQHIDVLVSEVGPRDGLQNTRQFMPTEYKKKWISAAAAAGLREIEVCSFVPPKLIPQMVDAAEVVAHALTIPGLTVAVLAPNLKGSRCAQDHPPCFGEPRPQPLERAQDAGRSGRRSAAHL
jgi:hydroxymethylglutaryl-CoA lyase